MEIMNSLHKPANPALVTIASMLLLAISCVGCSRAQYRVHADQDVHELIAERNDPSYILPVRTVAADSHSRMADFSDPDCGPLPPDDPAASRFMKRPYKSNGSDVWYERGQLSTVENGSWQQFLPADMEGGVRLNRQTAMELALLHGRDYQQQVEGIYLQALPVSLERFAFDAQWTTATGLNFQQVGGNTTGASRTLTLTDSLGFGKRFASGGQLLADFSNALAWEYKSGVSSAASQLSFQFLQPLMRRAFQEVQLEPLTQSERSLLYAVRDFARFRRTFYVNTVGSNGYLGLLAIAQAIRNEEANLQSLQRNRAEHDALLEAGLVSQFQVDQVNQDFDQGQLSLLQARAAFDTALDAYKLQLGLPPTQPMSLDSDELKLFELNDPELEALTSRNEVTRVQLLQYSKQELPELAQLENFLNDCEQLTADIPAIATRIDAELRAWSQRLPDADFSDDGEASADSDDRNSELANRLSLVMAEIQESFSEDSQQLVRVRAAIAAKQTEDAWAQLNKLCGKQLRERLADLFVVQTQVRVFLIETKPLKISESTALELAFSNRLDLKNQQGQVVDAYRRTEVAADLLEADLDLVLGADLGTDNQRRNPLRFDVSASRISAGLQFDGPLNRLAERNVYRGRQIEYQQARRSYMQAKDEISFEVRNTLRNLNLNRFQFEITRQQLITAARQVEQAQFNLRSSTEPDSNLTRDLLQALQRLLQSRNSLISSWVQYETSRMQVHRALGVLQVNDSGEWLNDGESFQDIIQFNDTAAANQFGT